MSSLSNPIYEAYIQAQLPGANYSNIFGCLAANPEIDFKETVGVSGKNIFHRCTMEQGERRLEAILAGFLEGSRSNKTIEEAVNAKWKKRTPLFIVAEGRNFDFSFNSSYFDQNRARRIAELLLALGANPAITCNVNGFDQTPESVASRPVIKRAFTQKLMDYLERGEFDYLLTKLKRSSFDPAEVGDKVESLKKSDGSNAIVMALKIGHRNRIPKSTILKVIEALSIRGAKMSSRNNLGESPLILAIKFEYPEIVSYIIQGLQSLVVDDCGNTALHKAAEYNTTDEICRILMTKDPGLAKAVNVDRATPLHFVKSKKLVPYLCLMGGLNPLDEDNHGRTSIMMAQGSSNTKVADQLRLFTKISHEERLEIMAKYPEMTTIIWNVLKTCKQFTGTAVWPVLSAAGTILLPVLAKAVADTILNILGVKE